MEKENSIMENQNEKELTLSDGRVCKVKALTGRAMRDAQRTADSDTSKVMFALTAIATTIDGNPIVMEDLEDMPLKDALKIQEAFSSINF